MPLRMCVPLKFFCWFCFDCLILLTITWKSSAFYLLTDVLIAVFVLSQQLYELKEIDFVILVYSLGAACLELGGHEV